ncbi:SAM-dependent methyltransferase [Pyrenophora tritici-repentis]|uniref:Methyltransf-10 containing protein n=1 Tax=Pyrenophora tritici-repentis TaxID=45151 RepID=A0A2W1D5V0_9PLEO|nr:SAM-dependent methyltransferase [Pyrenophora tritici-repentis]KAF7447378.1 SAM-dependent methyltransferase [Pyrenophora tritici-repentis]KAF7569747.1 SAM-dependent methyltransferase [Pyrenophora tritici-repentis]KAG9382530.1 SAM-dependent methyltransferase [Pyrenophora tritici-repentis]KAI0572020.1 SAM-dependent methyltransferase [Pyrenophora tritici-repentis]
MQLAQRPPYETVDFKALAKSDKNFKQLWQRTLGKLDFQDPETIQTLSKAILKVDFGLELHVPGDRLCPPIPNRWNYVAWLQGLIDSTSPNYTSNYDPNRQIRGLDIGTGASAIYTLLCLKSRPNWSMCATDIDKKSFESAARNLALNTLMTRTKLLQTTELNPLIPLAALGVDHLDFTICNPPFFNDVADMQSSLKGEGKSWKPNAVCTGSENEMVYPGGDVGFVTKMVNESLVLREKVQWYTSLFGKLDSAKAIIRLLKHHGINNWAVGVVEVGSSTKRWIVAWSFGHLRPNNSHARIEKIANEYLPFPTSYTITIPPDANPQDAKHTINTQFSSLDLIWTWDPATSTGIGQASQNVWRRAYRRDYERKQKEGLVDMKGDSERKVEIAFRVIVVDLAREVVLEWLAGTDRVLWESVCGLVHRHFRKA